MNTKIWAVKIFTFTVNVALIVLPKFIDLGWKYYWNARDAKKLRAFESKK